MEIINSDTNIVSSAYVLNGTQTNLQITGNYDGTVVLSCSLNTGDASPAYAALPADISTPSAIVLAEYTGVVGLIPLNMTRKGFGIKAELTGNSTGDCVVRLSADVIKTVAPVGSFTVVSDPLTAAAVELLTGTTDIEITAIGDARLANVVMTVGSDNEGIATGAITGTGSSRTLTVTGVTAGTCIMTVTATDGLFSSNTTVETTITAA